MSTEEVKIERGSGNVFADWGIPDADTHLLKAELVTRIDENIRRRRLTETRAADLLGLSEPDLSRLLRGSFREYSVERLTALERDVDIPKPKARSQGPVSKLLESGGRFWAGLQRNYGLAEVGGGHVQEEFAFGAADGSSPGPAPQEASSGGGESEEIGICETPFGTVRFRAEGKTVILEMPSGAAATQVNIANQSYRLKPSPEASTRFRVEGLEAKDARNFALDHRDDPDKFPLSLE